MPPGRGDGRQAGGRAHKRENKREQGVGGSAAARKVCDVDASEREGDCSLEVERKKL